MSVVSRSQDDLKWRYLRAEEINLISRLTASIPLNDLKCVKVYDLSDGGMGSVRVLDKHILEQKIHEYCASVFFDKDGTQISVTINVDDIGHFYELDIWKVDFSPIISYPKVENDGSFALPSLGGPV